MVQNSRKTWILVCKVCFKLIFFSPDKNHLFSDSILNYSLIFCKKKKKIPNNFRTLRQYVQVIIKNNRLSGPAMAGISEIPIAIGFYSITISISWNFDDKLTVVRKLRSNYVKLGKLHPRFYHQEKGYM